MIKPVQKPKRGVTQFFYEGTLVYFNNIRGDGKYIISYDANLSTVFDVDYTDLEPVKDMFSSSIHRRPKELTDEEKTDTQKLNEFYRQQALIMPYNCENCGKPLYASTAKFKRGVTAHILPKAEFESIKTNPLNVFFLGWALIGVCTCHDDWDRKGAKNRTTMKVYPEALERFEKMKPEMTGHEIVKAHTYLNIEWQ